MPRISSIQTNFTTGEISQQLHGRTDLKHYFNGVRRASNNVIKPQGGAFRRPGTIFSAEVKDSSKKVLLVEFEFSDIQAYMLEFGNNYVRFYKNGNIIISPIPPYFPIEVATTYLESELPNLRFAQSADILYIVHPSHPPMQMQRFNDYTWTWVSYVNLDGPYLATDKSETTMTVSNVVDRAKLTSTNADFSGADVNKYVEYQQGGKRLLGQIVAFIDSKNVTIAPLQNVLDTIDPKAVFTYAAPNLTSTVEIFSQNVVGSYIRRTASTWHLINGITSVTVVTVDAAVTMAVTTGSLSLSERTITANVVSSTDVFVSTDVDRHIRFNFQSTQIWGKIKTITDGKHATLSLDTPVPDRQTDPRDPSPGITNGAVPPVNADPNVYAYDPDRYRDGVPVIP